MIPALLLVTTLAVVPPANATTVDLGAAKLYEQRDVGALLVGMEFVVGAGTARQTPAQSGLAALSAQSLLLTMQDGATLTDRITAAGGSIDYIVDPDVTRFSIEATPEAMPAIASAFAAALRAPVTPAAVAAARKTLDERIDERERNPIIVGLEMLRGSYYQGSAGSPILGTSSSLTTLGPTDVAGFIADHYRSGNAFATATGQVDDATIAAARTVIAALPSGSEAAAPVVTKPFAAETKRLITHRDLGVPFVLVGFAAPAMNEKDFAAMLVLRALIGGLGSRSSSSTLAPFERGINVVYTYDVKPSSFTVAINGSQIDPAAGLTLMQSILKDVVAKPLDADVVSRFRDTAHGQWALEALSLTDRAWQLGAGVAVGGDPGTAQRVADAILQVTPADVQRMAKTYLQHYTVALVLPRSGS